MLPLAIASAIGTTEPAPGMRVETSSGTKIETSGEIVIECADEQPELCAVALEQGDFAPFAGQLLTAPLALALGQAADGCDARTKLLLERQATLLNLEHAREIDDLRPHFWERPLFVAALTATSFALVLLASSRVP